MSSLYFLDLILSFLIDLNYKFIFTFYVFRIYLMKKNVLIITEKHDSSTDRVMDWIHYYKCSFVRVNCENIFEYFNEFEVRINSKGIDRFITKSKTLKADDKFDSIWFRRDVLPSLNFAKIAMKCSENNNNTLAIHMALRAEYLSLKELTLNDLEKRSNRILGNYKYYFVNKLLVLQKAKALSIDIPDTLITGSKKKLQEFYYRHKGIVTKPIDYSPDLNHEGVIMSGYTEEITESNLEKIPDSFFPSLFQEKLNKEIEIRSFYINRNFYSTAIFSQLDTQTSVDFRRYNVHKGNRQTPFQLPKELEQKVTDLMNELNLNTGSIDIIKTIDGKYVFLEVNPVGQYGKTAASCNYYIDKTIAAYLLDDY